MWLFKKNNCCRHYYSCPERFLKNMFRTSISLLLCTIGLEYLSHQTFAEIARKAIEENTDKELKDSHITLGIASLIGIISAGVALFKAKSCLTSHSAAKNEPSSKESAEKSTETSVNK